MGERERQSCLYRRIQSNQSVLLLTELHGSNLDLINDQVEDECYWSESERQGLDLRNIQREKNKTKQAVPIKSKPPPGKFSKFIRQYTANYFILLQLLTEQAGPPQCRRHFRGIAGASSLMPLRTRSWHPNPHSNALERKIPLFCLLLPCSLWHKRAGCSLQ